MARIPKPPIRESGYYDETELLRIPASGVNPDGTPYTLPTERQYGENAVVVDGAVTFPNSAAAGSVQSHLVSPLPAQLATAARYLVVVRNPSTVTALTVRLRNRETLGGAVVFPELLNFPVPANSSAVRVVEGFLLGEASRVDFHNDTALGLADTFSAQVRVRRI